MKTLTAEQIADIRKRIEFTADDVCTIDAAGLDKLLTVAESSITRPASEPCEWTVEPWRFKDFIGTHQIHAESVDPDSDAVALLSMADYSRSVDCVNAFAGVVNPSQFMQAVIELVNAIDDVPELNPSNYHHDDVADCERAKGQMFAAWNRLRVVGGKAVS